MTLKEKLFASAFVLLATAEYLSRAVPLNITSDSASQSLSASTSLLPDDITNAPDYDYEVDRMSATEQALLGCGLAFLGLLVCCCCAYSSYNNDDVYPNSYTPGYNGANRYAARNRINPSNFDYRPRW